MHESHVDPTATCMHMHTGNCTKEKDQAELVLYCLQ